MTAVVEAIEEDQKLFMESLDGESGDTHHGRRDREVVHVLLQDEEPLTGRRPLWLAPW